MALINNTTSGQFDWNNQQFKKWMEARDISVDYYNGNTDDFTKQWMARNIIKNVPITNNNITKRIIDRISLVYSEDASRTASNDRYNDFIPNKDIQLSHGERRLNLLNLIAIAVVWRNDRIEYDVLDTFVPEFGDDPMVPIAVSYPVSTTSDVFNITGQPWIRVDAEEFVVFDNGSKAILSTEPNPFGILPVVFGFTEKPTTGFLHVDPAWDLIQSNLSINVLTTDMSANIRFQSFGIPYATGFLEERTLDILTGPDKLTLLPANSSVGMLSPPDTVMSLVEGIKFNYQVIAQNYHLPVGFVEGNAQAESGVALRLRNAELMDVRKVSVKIWRNIESNIFEVERAILSVAAGVNLSEDFNVDFGEHDIIFSPEEQRAQDDYDLSHNFITDAQILRRNDPDGYSSDADAQKFIDDNRKTNAQQETFNLADILAPAPVEEV